MEINAANVACVNFFMGSLVEKKANSVQVKRKGHTVWNENIQRYVSVKFPSTVVKFQIAASRFYAFMKIT